MHDNYVVFQFGILYGILYDNIDSLLPIAIAIFLLEIIKIN